MPIRISHAPVGAALSLARIAGEGAGFQQAFSQDTHLLGLALQQQRMADERQAGERAFALQSAMADRISRTPTAASRRGVDTPLDRMLLKRQLGKEERAARDQAQMDQLDQLRASGGLSAAAYERAKLGVMARNEGLVRAALAGAKPEKPRISQAQELSLLRTPFARKRKALETQRENLEEWRGAPNVAERYGSFDAWKRQLDSVTQQIQQLDTEEMKVVDAFRAGRTVDPVTRKTGPQPPPQKGEWDGQLDRSKKTGRIYEWRKDKWNLVGGEQE